MTLDPSRALRRSDTAYLAPLSDISSGFVYSDCWVDDARLVVLNALDAHRHGATIRTRCGVTSARRSGETWSIALSDGSEVGAHALVNAAGPWVAQMLSATGSTSRSGVRLIKGSHIVVPKLFDGHHAYMLQQPDGRIVFAIAYAGDTTLIGTTDVPVDAPEDAQTSDSECDYLINAANRYFKAQLDRAQILKTYSGVRPLYDDGASDAKAVTRDYVLELDNKNAPLLSVFGGKITTARQLAEDAMEKLGGATGWAVHPATRTALFPGAEINGSFPSFLARVQARWPFLGSARALRMARAYGAILEEMLADIGSAADMGEDFGGGLTQIEVDWLVRHEWAQTEEDILFRRTKIGLAADAITATRLSEYLGHHC